MRPAIHRRALGSTGKSKQALSSLIFSSFFRPSIRSLSFAACLIFGALPASATPNSAQSSQSSTTASPPSKAKKKKSKHRGAAKREPKQSAPDSDRITQIQSALTRAGFYQGDATGKWDADTVAAMQKFQSSNGLDATGKLDALSLQKLGLGSEIAGVSAPKPVVRVSVTPSASPSSPSAPAPASAPSATPTPAQTAAPPSTTN